MEDNAIRTIMTGVGLFIIVLTLSGIILYVNAARKMATVVDKSLNSWDEITVSNIMDYTGDISIMCTGADFVNFLHKNFLREDIYITISSVTTMQNLPISYWKGESTGNVSEVKLANINRSAEIVMKKSTTTNSNGVDKHVITIEGDVFANRDAYVTDSVWKMEKDSLGNYAYVTDGTTTIYIGDKVMVGGASWNVLGAYDGKILLLGSKSQITLDVSKEIELEEFNDKFANMDDAAYVVSGSARCLNVRDIERLIDGDVDEDISGLFTDKAKAMLKSDGYIFLMSISKENGSYTAKVLKSQNSEVDVEDKIISNSLTCYVSPVIALEQYAKLESTSQGSWRVSN